MYKGEQRFNFFMDQLQLLLTKAQAQKNPALWLYSNNARTLLFMLEALAKLYAALHNKKRFTKIKEQFKALEDVIGAIDYYDSISKDFAGKKNIPPAIVNYLQAQTREKIQSFNELLVEKKWLGKDENRIDKIRSKIKDADWLEEKEEVEEIRDFYGEAIYDIIEFIQERKFHYDNMETDVHELRRKLRWLSIYPQALLGSVQLTENKPMPKHLTKYITKEIRTLAFNKMPDAGDNKYFLLLSKNYFYALSWMIDQLGTLKDSGLHIIALKEALQQTVGLDEAAALKKAYQLLDKKQVPLQVLLDDAEVITKVYFQEHNLEHLVAGIKQVN
jgi:hypothetical protein